MIAKTETSGGCRILRVSGRIDFESALDFEHHINAMIQGDDDCYIIELSQVDLLSSAGLRVMLSTAKRVAQRDASLALAAPSQVVRQVFEISHFNLLFKIFPTVAAAISALKGTIEIPQQEESVGDSIPVPGIAGKPDPSFVAPVVPGADSMAQPPPAEVSKPESGASVTQLPPTIERVRPGLPTVSPPPASVESASVTVSPSGPKPPSSSTSRSESPTVAPPPLPPAASGTAKGSVGPAKSKTPEVRPSRQNPPPLPSTSQSSASSSAARSADPVTRREAKYPALLEVRAEGASYPCKDGDVIGTEGRLAQPFFGQMTSLAPRHLLVGQLEGRWFVFTPQNVQHPFIVDGVVLRAGERRMLQYVEHQAEFNGHVFGFRLVSEQPKEGFFARLFRRKK